jgi:hypothetical protein
MDREEKRRLKKLGKSLVEKRSSELRTILDQTNPASPLSDAFIENEIKIRKKEHSLRSEERIRKSDKMRKDFIIRPIEFDLAEYYPDVPGWYWECRVCGDFLPTWTKKKLCCSCGAVRLNDDKKCQYRFLDEGQLRLVRLQGKVEKRKPWWQFWK